MTAIRQTFLNNKLLLLFCKLCGLVWFRRQSRFKRYESRMDSSSFYACLRLSLIFSCHNCDKTSALAIYHITPCTTSKFQSTIISCIASILHNGVSRHLLLEQLNQLPDLFYYLLFFYGKVCFNCSQDFWQNFF